MSELRVLLADDHPPTRAGVRWTLEQAGMVVCAEVGDAESAIEAAEREQPDVCLIDLNMPGSGLVATRAITARVPGTTVVVLTISDEEGDAVAALAAGAAGFLVKDMPPAEMPAAIRAARGGVGVVPSRLLRSLLSDGPRAHGRRFRLPGDREATLTPREWQVLDHLTSGASTAEAAALTEMSVATVRTHVASIVRKLGVRDRQAAIDLARRQLDLG